MTVKDTKLEKADQNFLADGIIMMSKKEMKQYYIFVDFEMCRLKGNETRKMQGRKNEIIQMGAVLLKKEQGIVDEFVTYVKPQYGKVDAFIESLTGIKQEDVENAPMLRTVLMQFADWIGDRKVTVLSWSDSDYQQLTAEMNTKKIRHHKIQDLLDGWVDLQYSFDKMLGLKNQYSLEDAMVLCGLKNMGRAHDALCDAYNTARLYQKIQRQSIFCLNMVPVSEYKDQIRHLTFSIKELITPEILAQICTDVEDVSVEEKVGKKGWSIWRRLRGFIHGQEMVTNVEWNKYIFSREMKKIDLKDFFRLRLQKAEA